MKTVLLSSILIVMNMAAFANVKSTDISPVIKDAKKAMSSSILVKGSSKKECMSKLNNANKEISTKFKVFSINECKLEKSYVGKRPQNKTFVGKVNFL